MRTSQGFTRVAGLACCLAIPLWLGGCTSSDTSSTTGAAEGSALSQLTPAPALAAPEPEAQPAPTPVTEPAEGGSPQLAPRGTAGPYQEPAAETPPPGTTSGGSASTASSSPGPALPPEPSPTQGAALPAGNPPAPAASARQSGTAYFVMLDDGGSGGVRFGCNDSLVSVPLAAPLANEPLQSALQALLPGSSGGGSAPDGLYNSLASSTLSFVSGYFDGSTVVVNLSGTVSPAGTCDIPRIEAQLTQTAVTAVGATRAEIYINGRRLAEVLSLR
ncbi:GerMN domain-containing protein [Arthrobacter sp.]|uniref:GerMN domain-containing protein n=1 Tax=Arthrobacter sp. TaxID=1667 RepID=UPI0028119932|nr:GerMN domain-containing protein [Arthrobacter sp.]